MTGAVKRRIRVLRSVAGMVALTAVFAASSARGDAARPWLDRRLTPDARADLVVRAMTQDEKLGLVHGAFGASLKAAPSPFNAPKPAGAIGSGGFVAGIPRLGIPALQESDAGLGVANGGHMRPGDEATAMPAGLALAASWDPALAFKAGAAIGREARGKGFNVLLGGAANLTRDPRGGRNFEYAGEDALLAGMIVGKAVAGVQSANVISTMKHFAVNNQEIGRAVLSAEAQPDALRESDLLVFERVVELGRPGAVMTAYNRVNGVYASESPFLLTDVLKGAWGYKGWVMSDWGGVHSTVASALAGLDQQSAHSFDQLRVAATYAGSDRAAAVAAADYYGAPLRAAVASGAVPQSRLDDMVRRILRSMFAVGVVDAPERGPAADLKASAAVAQRVAEAGMVLLKNDRDLLPLTGVSQRVVMIGGHADLGVLSGGGSSQVIPIGGAALEIPLIQGPAASFARITYSPSSPLKALRTRLGRDVLFDPGTDIPTAVALARTADVVLVFAEKWQTEAEDSPDLGLTPHQDALIAAVAAANPRTVVVLETGNPVLMPWLGTVGAVLEAWYPGQRGGEAIARILLGDVSPSGRLPMTFPASVAQLPRPELDGAKLPSSGLFGVTQPFPVTYGEGSDVGYRWFERTGAVPLFPFGYGLSYAQFEIKRSSSGAGAVTIKVRNTSRRFAAEIAQLYVRPPGAGSTFRLAGWARIALRPGATGQVALIADKKALARYDGGWRVNEGEYDYYIGGASGDRRITGTFHLDRRNIKAFD